MGGPDGHQASLLVASLLPLETMVTAVWKLCPLTHDRQVTGGNRVLAGESMCGQCRRETLPCAYVGPVGDGTHDGRHLRVFTSMTARVSPHGPLCSAPLRGRAAPRPFPTWGPHGLSTHPHALPPGSPRCSRAEAHVHTEEVVGHSGMPRSVRPAATTVLSPGRRRVHCCPLWQ